MSMAMFRTRNQDMTWQDRTINIEVMMAPIRAQLLYNKHKGLNTKYRQESSNLEREKSSYLRSFRTDIRLMERRKDMYTRRRNDIQVRRVSADSRHRSTDGGRKSAPPRLEQGESRGDNTFLTQLDSRDSKSAEPSVNTDSFRNFHRQIPDRSKLNFANRATPVTPAWSTPTPVVGKPYLKLERRKSVRFCSTFDTNKINEEEDDGKITPAVVNLEDKIKNFMKTQSDFNKKELMSASYQRDSRKAGFPTMQRRRSSVGPSAGMLKMENAFNDFCMDKSQDGFSKLVRYASKMRGTLKNARSVSIVPPVFGDNSNIPIIRV